jgi:ribosomal protein S18 acetylase RimI-like enzyme
MMEIRALGESDAAAFRALRLRALGESPEAFGSTLAEEAATAAEAAAERYGLATDTGDAGDRFVLGAVDASGALVAVAGCVRERRAKARHRAGLWGMYVVPECRGRGLGRALVHAVCARAREWPGLEQITLQVVVSCRPARALYSACGFVPFGLQPGAYLQDGRYVDVEHMLLELSGREP